ncbi:hypothetical protein JAAARDRAFT_116582 [Jaapia argillacea MUCL 33604]|uniref:GPI inositol-deacylase n=1 Tax=Jaapia argillacea MUCL 33604 TaxID=933084 RepID=A0A067QE96_9AGAM|nr:hypothetical protein JAAARDRAFT_116582 [Jaapia argillacea MUCL 33604]
MRLVAALACLSLLLVAAFYACSSVLWSTLSPQGCRMSWMSPSYILQSKFDTSWSPLARRYSLALYREVGWDSSQPSGFPVLFIPGNAGSSHQVRSIASSSTRQFFSSPSLISPSFLSRSSTIKPLDFFSLEFNEDLSAFHGPTLSSQTSYASSAISYILSLHPPNTTIIILGHSMGGIVATSLLPNPNISALITMSTPHTLPPAPFDKRIQSIYESNSHILQHHQPTPILSICGGATDMMIPSESCVLPPASEPNIYRRTIFTSALEGAWTGVGHREMVWCHQVRWRVARAALELASASSPNQKGLILDQWLNDGHHLPNSIDFEAEVEMEVLTSEGYQVVNNTDRFVLANPQNTQSYLFPIPTSQPQFILYLSGGTLLPYTLSPHAPLTPLQITIHLCSSSPSSMPTCTYLKPTPSSLKLIPNPPPDKTFPLPDEGTDESDGVVFFSADIPPGTEEGERWVVVKVVNGSGGDEKAWIVAGFSNDNRIQSDISTTNLLFKPHFIPTPTPTLLTKINLPNILSNVLLIYHLTPIFTSPSCFDPFLPSLLQHTSSPSESHYHPLTPSSLPNLLHTHSTGPYIPSPSTSGLNLTIYTSNQCPLDGITLGVDWRSTLGRWGTRYWSAVLSWGIGVVGIILWQSLGVAETGASFPDIRTALRGFIIHTLPSLLLLSFTISFIPLPTRYYLGNKGEPLFAPIAPLVLLISSGLVCTTSFVLEAILWVVRKSLRKKPDPTTSKNSFISLLLIFILIFLFIPWQVAFLGTWLIHIGICSTHSSHSNTHSHTRSTPSRPPTNSTDSDDSSPSSYPPHTQSSIHKQDAYAYTSHLLLLMTWLLPLVAPVLAVWARTLLTADWTTPFDGDHNFLNVAPWLVIVDFLSWSRGVHNLIRKKSWEWVSIRTMWLVLALAAFLRGAQGMSQVFDVATVSIALTVLVRIGPRYWGRS